MAWLWRSYMTYVNRYPLKSQAYSTGFLFFTGDVAAQQLVERKGKSHDVYRTFRQTVFGLVVAGPLLRGWYVYLDRIYKASRPQTAGLKKMLTDQILMAPTFVFTFFTTMSFASGMNVEQVKHKIHADYLDTLVTGYKIWPVVQLANFYLVPLQHRVLVVNVVALFWNTYLAWKANL